MSQYWYNVETHAVEKDAQSGWKSLIGPYESAAEAERALAKVQERNAAADALDEESDDD
ncbi:MULTISPECIES: SPOR domain-containing protein [unclassified Arthrobacter]|uniref:SPOR domain-containing protein n=1 Tax=unclassified Arthrobacter TaxID=235627 RepID=UPI0011B0E271|nr:MULTISPECIES: SPOR domain-containing protein [unclassified Arthrobacter]